MWRARARYWFDSTMSRGTPALVGWLGLASTLLVLIVSVLVIWLVPGDVQQHGGWPDVFWLTLMRAIDAGTVSGDSGSPVFMGLMLAITVGGIFVVSAFIGVLTTGLEGKIADLRKGRSKVVERGHTVVLGWSEQVFTVVAELVQANHSQRRSCIAILADKDKVEMEDALRARVGDLGRTVVVCRTGNPLRPADLDLVNLAEARSVMVLPPPVEDADIQVIKILLALGDRSRASGGPQVVAAVNDSDNLAAAQLAGGPRTQLVGADDLAVRLIVQAHRQSGLSAVCTDLLAFAGTEFYLRAEASAAGQPFGEVSRTFDRGIPVGLRAADGKIELNPPSARIVDATDELIVLADDDSLIHRAHTAVPILPNAIAPVVRRPAEPARTLMIGWNKRAPKIVALLDEFAAPGSHLQVAGPDPTQLGSYTHLTVGTTYCDPTNRAELEALDVATYQHVIVLSADGRGGQEADARTLLTLLHLRDLEQQLGDPYSIVSEINDEANREIAQVTRADDFVVSEKLISLLLTQLTENRNLAGVFAELLSPDGAEIYLNPAADYVVPGEPANFATLAEAARRRGETAIGYRTHADFHRPPAYGVVLNPAPDAPVTLGAGDRVVVLADHSSAGLTDSSQVDAVSSLQTSR
ncbi:potassium transporter TrkA [Kribbella sandramycini]|uniref:Potassium transporter TrkA n=1 Tax=Kribbella sandramycini TaxID=60450 RepID=A0A7Y4P413_9ACTN|nr:potassium transporter TrkA [Kribbella sandramycini]MBB6566997.1 voltage-gated potassium channel Kch [Kribbella sandramycini]NOL44719.1 potassium transporter TrkA [Kribbella sandramycini]